MVPDLVVFYLQVDFWRAADSPGQHVDIWVQQPSDARLFSLLGKNRIKYSIRLTNLTRSVELANVSMANIDHFDSKYHSFNEVSFYTSTLLDCICLEIVRDTFKGKDT